MPPPDPLRRATAIPKDGGKQTRRGGGIEFTLPPPYVRFSYRGACGCADRLAALERLVGQLCENLDVDVDLLELLGRPTVAHGIPASWEACEALGIDPVTGEFTS